MLSTIYKQRTREKEAYRAMVNNTNKRSDSCSMVKGLLCAQETKSIKHAHAHAHTFLLYAFLLHDALLLACISILWSSFVYRSLSTFQPSYQPVLQRCAVVDQVIARRSTKVAKQRTKVGRRYSFIHVPVRIVPRIRLLLLTHHNTRRCRCCCGCCRRPRGACSHSCRRGSRSRRRHRHGTRARSASGRTQNRRLSPSKCFIAVSAARTIPGMSSRVQRRHGSGCGRFMSAPRHPGTCSRSTSFGYAHHTPLGFTSNIHSSNVRDNVRFQVHKDVVTRWRDIDRATAQLQIVATQRVRKQIVFMLLHHVFFCYVMIYMLRQLIIIIVGVLSMTLLNEQSALRLENNTRLRSLRQPYRLDFLRQDIV
mmetsp:Transcript_13837/g.23618  ORF Transcript_13837/g.23618 Transcript_13837/m.23618 type:complete len:366 (-) Transcript_13837:1207-2304(-)